MAFRKNLEIKVNGYLLSHHETRVINECFRQLKPGAQARGLSVAMWALGPGTLRMGLEFRDRTGRYGCLTAYDMRDETTADIWAMVAALGLDVRVNRELKPSKRQLSLAL